MDSCDDILKQGIFNDILVTQNLSVTANIFEWLKKSTFSEVKKKIDAGLKGKLPIKGIPVELDANFTEDQFEQWKEEVDAGTVQNFTQQESLTLVERSVDKGIVDAWKDCMGRGLRMSISEPRNQPSLVLTARYVPNDVTDTPPIVTSLDVIGAMPSRDLKDVEVEIAGNAVILQRQAGRGLLGTERTPTPDGGVVEITRTEVFAAIAVALNTTKGSKDASVEAFVLEDLRVIPPPPKVQITRTAEIETTGADAAVVSGDDEIDTDDWTKVQLTSQNLRLSPDRRTVLFDLEWKAFEGEKNQTIKRNETIIRSMKTFEFPFEKAIIELQSPPSFDSREEWYAGEIHDHQS